MAFKDHFSDVADAYAAHRPLYPAALAEWLAAEAPARELAWDAGTGSGQLARRLAGAFARVVASDASERQIAAALPHPGVVYRVAPAEASGLPDGCADLCAAAQAAHWFDLPRYWAEVRRVARPGALVALVTYAYPRPGPDGDPALDAFSALVRPWWPPERAPVDTLYRTLPFPFAEVAAPALEMTARWTGPEMAAYLRTWSSTQALARAGGGAAIERALDALVAAWGAGAREVRWPLGIRAGRP